ncbi:ATP-binding protein [Streptomyces sp. NPDC092296]|uniref:ATP-binding protein n=1 Tax=Streptomyces sp. NPDC092296 TaxID=3366012 RepID=UPI00380A1207
MIPIDVAVVAATAAVGAAGGAAAMRPALTRRRRETTQATTRAETAEAEAVKRQHERARSDTEVRRARERAEQAATRAQQAEALAADADQRAEQARRELADLTAALREFAEVRLPAAARRAALPFSRDPGLSDSRLPGSEPADLLQQCLHQVEEAVLAEQARTESGAAAVLSGATRSMQVALYDTQSRLRTHQMRFSGREMAEANAALRELDHTNEQLLRLVQELAVLSGSWPGVVREVAHLADIVSGAGSRLKQVDRIRAVHRVATGTAVAAHAVEPLAMVLTALIGNGLRFSPPDSALWITTESAHNGAVVTIDDAGVGMTREERDRAMAVAGGHLPVHFSDLGDPPRRGLAVVGRLVSEYGFGVNLGSPSPYGGVRVVVFVPTALLTRLDERTHPLDAATPRAHSGRMDIPPPVGPEGLPQRRRRTAATPAPAPVAAPTAAASPEAARGPRPEPDWAGFQRAVEASDFPERTGE